MRRRLCFYALILTLAACTGSAIVPQRQAATDHSRGQASHTRAQLPNPALLGINQSTGALEAWPISSRGGAPVIIDPNFGVTDGIAMAADGKTIFVARYHGDEVLEYNVMTGGTKILPDSYGEPIDIAIGTDKSVYIVNAGKFEGIIVYPQGRNSPRLLPCNLMDSPGYVAVDNNGNVFVNGYEGSQLLVVEIPRGGACRNLHLRPESSYVSGLAFDPKSGDLLVMDDPGVCAGPPGARITIYPKPYTRQNARSLSYGGSCDAVLRLNAASTRMFFTMPTLNGGSIVLQAALPGGKVDGNTYNAGDTYVITTIPNTLPN